MVDNKKNINIASSPQLSNFNNSDDPKSYFSSQIEGKRNFGPRFDSKQNLIPYSIIGSKEIFDLTLNRRTTNLNSTTSSAINGAMKMLSNQNTKKDDKLVGNYNNNIIKMDNNDITKMYINLKKRIQANEELFSNEKLPININETLKKQEYLLNYNLQSAKKRDHLNNFICKKSKKKENELLIISSPIHRIKSELRNIIDSKQPVETSLNFNEWVTDLRSKPDDPFKGTYYLNGGSQSNPLWSRRKNVGKNHSLEFIRPTKMETLIPNIEMFKMSKFVKDSVNKYNINLDNLLNIDKIKVEGKNLLEEENNVTLKMKGRKVLHKETLVDSINETIQLDYLSNKDRNFNDLSILRSQKFIPLKNQANKVINQNIS